MATEINIDPEFEDENEFRKRLEDQMKGDQSGSAPNEYITSGEPEIENDLPGSPNAVPFQTAKPGDKSGEQQAKDIEQKERKRYRREQQERLADFQRQQTEQRRAQQQAKKDEVAASREIVRDIRSQAISQRVESYSLAAAVGLPGYITASVVDSLFIRPNEDKRVKQEQDYQAELARYYEQVRKDAEAQAAAERAAIKNAPMQATVFDEQGKPIPPTPPSSSPPSAPPTSPPVPPPQPPVPQQNEVGYVKVKGRPVQKKLSSYAKHYVSKIRNSRKYKRKVEIQEKMMAMKQNIEKALGDIKNPANAMNMEVFWKTMDSEARTYTNQLVSVMHKVFENDQIQIIRALRRNKSALKEKGLSDVIAYLNESRYLKRLIEEEATDVITRANKQQGKRASSFISDKPYNQTPSIKKKLSDNTKKMGTSVMETRRDAIIRQLEEGILAQESIPKLANRLKEYYTDYESNKARQVAQTEVFRAFNMANVDAWDQDGVVTGKQWFTAADERTCEWCAPQHGKIQSLDKSFFDKGYELEGSRGGILNLDYGDVGTPPLHPYCRCTLAPIICGSKIADPTFGGVPVNAKEADFLEENDIKYVERRKNNKGVIARYNRKNNTMYVYDKESVNFQKTL